MRRLPSELASKSYAAETGIAGEISDNLTVGQTNKSALVFEVDQRLLIKDGMKIEFIYKKKRMAFLLPNLAERD